MQGRKSVFDWWCWGVILSLTFQVHLCGRLVIHADVRRKSTLSLSLSLSLSRSAALIPRQVLQCACSVGSSCLIVCYYFNTYIMYFIKICCQSLSVPLHPITQGPPPPLFIRFYLFIFVAIIFRLWFVFLLLPGIQLSWLLFYDVVMTPSDGFIISSPFWRVLIVASGLLSEKFHRVCSVLLNARSPKIPACFS